MVLLENALRQSGHPQVEAAGWSSAVLDHRRTLEHAPMIARCPLVMECRLVKTVDLPSNELFIGEIVAAYSEERFLTDGKPDIRKMNPFTLTMPDNGYWAVGERIGDAWSIGKGLRG